MLPSMARRKQNRPTYTVNQVIASNVAKARMLRGWTQQEAAEALAPHLGTKMSTASFSAIERSVDGGRVREGRDGLRDRVPRLACARRHDREPGDAVAPTHHDTGHDDDRRPRGGVEGERRERDRARAGEVDGVLHVGVGDPGGPPALGAGEALGAAELASSRLAPADQTLVLALLVGGHPRGRCEAAREQRQEGSVRELVREDDRPHGGRRSRHGDGCGGHAIQARAT